MPAPSADLGVRVSQSQLSGRASVGLAGLMKSCTMTETHRRTAAGAGGHGPPLSRCGRPGQSGMCGDRRDRPRPTRRHIDTCSCRVVAGCLRSTVSHIPRVSPAPPSRAPSSMSRRFQNGRFSRIALTRSYIPAAWSQSSLLFIVDVVAFEYVHSGDCML